jgi:hypothetical protein
MHGGRDGFERVPATVISTPQKTQSLAVFCSIVGLSWRQTQPGVSLKGRRLSAIETLGATEMASWWNSGGILASSAMSPDSLYPGGRPELQRTQERRRAWWSCLPRVGREPHKRPLPCPSVDQGRQRA